MTEFIRAIETWPQAIVAGLLILAIGAAVVVFLWGLFK